VGDLALLKDVAAVALLRGDGSVLLQHRDLKPGLNHSGLWVLPGGHRENSETIEECAKREFFEETAYRCTKLHWLLRRPVQTDIGDYYQLTVFWLHYDGIQQLQCLEGQDLRFIDRAMVETLPAPDFLVDLWDRAIAAEKLHHERGT